MQNGPGKDDESKRTPMAWDGSSNGGFTSGRPWRPLAPGKEKANVAAETNDPGSLLSLYRALIRVRQSSAALRRGDIALVRGTPPGVLAYLRHEGSETVLVAHSVADWKSEFTFGQAAGHRALPLFADQGANLSPTADGWRIELPAGTSGVWAIE